MLQAITPCKNYFIVMDMYNYNNNELIGHWLLILSISNEIPIIVKFVIEGVDGRCTNNMGKEFHLEFH